MIKLYNLIVMNELLHVTYYLSYVHSVIHSKFEVNVAKVIILSKYVFISITTFICVYFVDHFFLNKFKFHN